MKKLFPAFIFILSVTFCTGQSVSINTTGAAPHPSAALDISSTTKGMLIPRITSFPTNPAEGLLVYRSDLKCFYFNNGSDWVIMEGVYSDGDGIAINNNNEVSLAIEGQAEGDMMCFNGSEWVPIPMGTDGDVLTMENGTPVWKSVETASAALPTYTVGQMHEGGIIFYVDATGEHGLIAAISDAATDIPWTPSGTPHTLYGATGSAIYAGEVNTNTIVSAIGTGVYAARVAYDYAGGGYTDWYLPSLFEMNMLYNARALVGNFASFFYWTSTESNASEAFCVFFGDGQNIDDFKWGPANIRPIRRF